MDVKQSWEGNTQSITKCQSNIQFTGADLLVNVEVSHRFSQHKDCLPGTYISTMKWNAKTSLVVLFHDKKISQINFVLSILERYL